MSGSRPRRWNGSQRFKTDADISAATAGSQKPLQRWVDDGTAEAPLADLTLESKSKSRWDQFAANKEKFGIVPSYDELQYTTEVNKSHPEFAAREKRAIQIAKEIEGQAHGNNVHIAEERGIDIADPSIDEEDKYSGVKREDKESERRQKFAAKEARRAMASPSYLQTRERTDGSEDLRRFSQDFKVKGEVPADLLPILGKDPKAQVNDSKPKKKFNFAAAAAKGSSFKSSFSPSPKPSSGSASPVPNFVPGFKNPNVVPVAPGGMMHAPGVPHGVVPGMIPMVIPPPFMGAPPPGMPMHPMAKPAASPSAPSFEPPTPESTEIKPLGVAFDYIAVLKEKDEKIPPIFTTLPTWATTSTESYIEQLPTPQYMYQPYMPWGM